MLAIVGEKVNKIGDFIGRLVDLCGIGNKRFPKLNLSMNTLTFLIVDSGL